MIRFPSFNLSAPPLPVVPGSSESKPAARPTDRLLLGAELSESSKVDNHGFLSALKANFGVFTPPGLKGLLENRKDIKRRDLFSPDGRAYLNNSPEVYKLLQENRQLKPADLRGVDAEQVEVLRQRPELHPQELPRMDTNIEQILRPMIGERGIKTYLPLIRRNTLELMKKRADTRPEQMVELMNQMAWAGGVGSTNEAPEMFLKATQTLLRRPDLQPQQLGKFAQDLHERVLWDGDARHTQAAFNESMNMLQHKNNLDVDRLYDQMADMDREPARSASVERRGRVYSRRVGRLAFESGEKIGNSGTGLKRKRKAA